MHFKHKIIKEFCYFSKHHYVLTVMTWNNNAAATLCLRCHTVARSHNAVML